MIFLIKQTKKIKNKYILSVLTGTLLFLAYPFTGSITPFIFIALAPLLYVEDQLKNVQKSFFKVLKFINDIIINMIYHYNKEHSK